MLRKFNNIPKNVFEESVSVCVLRGRLCNTIVLNVHAPSEEKSNDSEDSVYEELEEVFDYFPTDHMKMLLGNLNAKVGETEYF